MIIVLDYGTGNMGSIVNMIRHVGGDAIIRGDVESIAKASKIILPGVGAFDNGMQKLRSSGLIDILNDKVISAGVPFLGICLGMQLLFDSSEEGQLPGLGWFPGRIVKFNVQGSGLKVPHMGWNEISVKRSSPLLKNLEARSRFYFVHSYHAACEDLEHSLAAAHYGYDFTCAVNKGNIYGTQFHPEKSHRFGMTLFKNFLDLPC